jgi:hypothetical protein
VEVYDCPEEVEAHKLKYPTPTVTEDMIENCGEYLRRGQCEVLIDELERLMEDETRADYDDLALKLTALCMALDVMRSDIGYD